MVDTAFDDFLDSEDDEFFREASNCFLDDHPFQDDTKNNKIVVEKQSDIITSNYIDSQVAASTKKQNLFSPCTTSTCENEGILTNISLASLSCDKPDNQPFVSECKNVNGEMTFFTNTTTDQNKITNISSTGVKIPENTKEDVAIIESASGSSSSVYSSLNKTLSPASSLYIDSRFTPGFTPTAKKRKLPGPAGLLELVDVSKEAMPSNSKKIMSMDMEFENIVSSQYTPEHLSLSSWQKLQTTVSSCSNLHSTAKYYSIKRILQESSKKKLPKHMVAPVLCVLLKKVSNKGSSVIPVFMDDTGEINGKIDAEVLSTYKDFLVEGTAFILKKVTFLCNVLILKTQNLVSLYHPNGTEKHPQSLESALETSEPLKPMNCECLKLPDRKKNTCKASHNNTPNNYVQNGYTHTPNRLNNFSNQKKTMLKTSENRNASNSCKSSYTNPIQRKIESDSKETVNRNTPNLFSKQSPASCVTPTSSKIMRSDAFLENLLDEDNCMDEFDELLGNLDEKSFMEDL